MSVLCGWVFAISTPGRSNGRGRGARGGGPRPPFAGAGSGRARELAERPGRTGSFRRSPGGPGDCGEARSWPAGGTDAYGSPAEVPNAGGGLPRHVGGRSAGVARRGPSRPVSGDADRRRREAMMACHHPQGRARPPGGRLRYWIVSPAHGRPGGLCLPSAGWTRGARDRAIGRSADARVENLPRPVRNHRFPLLPGVRVHGLASAAPRLAAGCVAEHWRERHRVRPVMACTYTGPGHDGCCHRAAGWRRRHGRTAGQPPGRPAAAPRVAAPPRRKMARDPLPRTRTPGGAACRRKGRPGATGVPAPAPPRRSRPRQDCCHGTEMAA